MNKEDIAKNALDINKFFEENKSSINYEKELNAEQYEAVKSINGSELIIAGAGTGKTRTLVYRLAYMIENGVMPEQILLLTFTNKAAHEMKSRAVKMLDERCSKIESGTYHSFCNKILRKYISKLEFKSNFNILDASDASEAISIVKDKCGYSNKDKKYPKGNALQAIYSASINKGISIEEVVKKDYIEYIGVIPEIKTIQKAYTKYKKDKNLLDYDDLLVLFVQLLTEHPEVKEKMQKTYRYIMVDEYQDSNIIQLELLKLLCGSNGNICVVGDPDQSIYGFRGSNYMNIINFPKQFNNCKTVILNQNYRSNQEILNLSNKITDQIENRVKKDLVGTWSKGSKPNTIIAKSTMHEAQIVFYNIMQEHKKGTPLKDMAVLIKKSSDSNVLESILIQQSDKYNIPYQKFGGVKFMERAFVKDILAFLKVINNDIDEISWFRLLKLLPNIGSTYANKIISGILENGLDELIDVKYSNRKYGAKLPSLHKSIHELSNMPFNEQIDNLINKYYKEIMKDTISQKRISKEKYIAEINELNSNIEEAQVLIKIADGYKSASKFLSDMTLDNNIEEEDEDKLTISTIHSAKGLEYKTVYILNCVDGVYPHINSTTTEEIEEELRVLYVALTRAKENLYIICPEMVFKYGTMEYVEPSRFLLNNNIIDRFTDIIEC